jgi:hypothetical protein
MPDQDKDEFVMVPRRELEEFRRRLDELERQVKDVVAGAGLPELVELDSAPAPSLQEQHQAFVARSRAADPRCNPRREES